MSEVRSFPMTPNDRTGSIRMTTDTHEDALMSQPITPNELAYHRSH